MIRPLLALVLFVPSAAAQTINTGLTTPAPWTTVAKGDILAFTVGEIVQGVDLDGDGDLQSYVLHLRVGAQGAIQNLQLPVPVYNFPSTQIQPFQMSEQLVAFVVLESELGSGGTDLNGDNDRVDRVVHVWDRATQQIVNTGLAGVPLPTGLAVAGDSVAMCVSESEQGQDLDGNGQLQGMVACTWTSPGILRNTGRRTIAATSGFSPGVAIAGGRAYFAQLEQPSGINLNGDGDLLDAVVQEMNLSTGAIQNLGLAADNLVASGAILACRVSEPNHGLDLNGDGDTNDRIQFVRLASVGVTRNLLVEVAVDGSGRSYTTIAGNLIAMRVRESAVPHVDYNGDGDHNDYVLCVHDARANVTWNTQTVTLPDGNFKPSSFLVDGTTVMFSVPEYDDGQTDLNGDGDTSDRVVHLFDAATGTVRNLGLSSGAPYDYPDAFRVSPRWITFLVSEISQGNTDLNGNGVVVEKVLHVYHRRLGTVQNLGIGIGGVGFTNDLGYVLDGTNVIYPMREQWGGDLNGDGDYSDMVAHRRDGATGVITNLGLALTSWTNLESIVPAGDSTCALTVSEVNQGADLNGDGDMTDETVLHLVQN